MKIVREIKRDELMLAKLTRRFIQDSDTEIGPFRRFNVCPQVLDLHTYINGVMIIRNSFELAHINNCFVYLHQRCCFVL
jgi:hypothetical protein